MEEAQPTATTTAAAVLATAGSRRDGEISTEVTSESAVDFTVAEVNATSAAAANDTAVQGYFYQVCFLPAAKPSGLRTVGVVVGVVVVGKSSTPPSRATSTRYDSMHSFFPFLPLRAAKPSDPRTVGVVVVVVGKSGFVLSTLG